MSKDKLCRNFSGPKSASKSWISSTKITG